MEFSPTDKAPEQLSNAKSPIVTGRASISVGKRHPRLAQTRQLAILKDMYLSSIIRTGIITYFTAAMGR